MNAQQWAARLLPPELAATIVHHELGQPLVQGGDPSNVRLYAQPTMAGDRLCRRQVYFVSFNSAGQAGGDSETIARTQVALAPGCRMPPQGQFADVQPQSKLESGTAALIWLADARRHAASIDVSCTSKYQPDPCRAGARKVLAKLPVHSTYLINAIETDERRGWDVAVAASEPGQLFWDVYIDLADAHRPQVHLTWGPPAPF
jgi:hypothetical protein